MKARNRPGGRGWRWAGAFALLAGAGVTAARQAPPAPPQPPPAQSQSEIVLVIRGSGGPPHLAVPDFIPLASDEETVAAARTIGEVLFGDLAFEREFDLIPRDTYRHVRPASSLADIPFDQWNELGADGLLLGTVRKEGNAFVVEARLFSVKGRQQAFGKQYSGSAANPRLFAHTIADDVHQQQRALRGVARTKLTFASDRDAETRVKEIYLCDYDGANERRVTINRSLNISPAWSPDAKAIAYTSYKRGSPDVFVSFIYQGTFTTPTNGEGQNFLPAWSPDGSRLAFTSDRDGNPEIYVMNRDGSGVRRLTHSTGIDTSPVWSPTGDQIAFTSDRAGAPHVYIMGADGLNQRQLTFDSYSDAAAWSPAKDKALIAYAARTGAGFDIKVVDLATRDVRQLTFGEGSNESPTWAPNGHHLAFSSTRSGKTQIFEVDADGRNVRQITRSGNNFMPDWSN